MRVCLPQHYYNLRPVLNRVCRFFLKKSQLHYFVVSFIFVPYPGDLDLWRAMDDSAIRQGTRWIYASLFGLISFLNSITLGIFWCCLCWCVYFCVSCLDFVMLARVDRCVFFLYVHVLVTSCPCVYLVTLLESCAYLSYQHSHILSIYTCAMYLSLVYTLLH